VLAVVRLDERAACQLAEGPRAAPGTLARVRRAVRARAERGTAPVVVVPTPQRIAVRDALAACLPRVRVLADTEIADEDRVEVFATIGVEEGVRAA
jgi:flagellar biosynthesis component FlhA